MFVYLGSHRKTQQQSFEQFNKHLYVISMLLVVLVAKYGIYLLSVAIVLHIVAYILYKYIISSNSRQRIQYDMIVIIYDIQICIHVANTVFNILVISYNRFICDSFAMVIIACVLQNSQYPIYIVIVVVNLYTIFSYIQSANIGYLFGCI